MSDAIRGGEAEAVLHLEVKNRMEEINRVLEAFEAFWSGRGRPDDARRRLKLALDELLANVILYGYEDEAEHLIDVTVRLTTDRVAVRIVDDGRPFNPLVHLPPDISKTIEEREIGGLGIHLIENLMDEVSHAREDDQNITVLVKHLPTG